MKKIINPKTVWLSAIIVLPIFSGCNKFLEQTSETSITDGVFWKTTSDLITGTNYLYSGLPSFANTPQEDRYSDIATDVFNSTINAISAGTRTPPGNDGNWSTPYTYIYAANNIIEKAAGITGDQAVIDNCIAQARFFRAMYYYMLVRAYGDVPYIDKTIAGSDDPALYTPRTDRRVVIDAIYADLDFAAANCPQADAISNTTSTAGVAGREYGRITRSAALALKSRVALFEGTFEKFHGEPALTGAKDPAKHLTIAKDAALIVMNEAKHSLFTGTGITSYQDLFRYPGETYAKNKENILVRLYGQNIANNVAGQNYLRNNLTDGTNAATRKYVTLALYSDGLPAGKSPLDSNGRETSPLTDFRNRDPRLVQTVFKPGDPTASINGAGNYGNTLYYHQQKYWTGQQDFLDAAQNNVFLDFIIIRYGEVLLNYAEAVYELNNSIADGDLDRSINLLRKRATNNDVTKLPLLTNAFVNTNGLNMREEIRRERTIELAFEGFRYWDLLRWKTAETELPQPILERKYFSNLNYGIPTIPPRNPDGYILMSPRPNTAPRVFNVARDYLWPIPTQQIGLSNNTLVQNPNW